MLVFSYLKFIVLLLMSLILCYICRNFGDELGKEIVNFLLFPLLFTLINYAFIRLILGHIRYYNNLLVIYNGELIVIKSTLFFMDNIEFIDINKITKLDTYCTGFIPNFLGYGNLVAEQQRDEVRTFPFVAEPFRALQLLNEEKQKTIKERKERYIISEEKETSTVNRGIISKINKIFKGRKS